MYLSSCDNTDFSAETEILHPHSSMALISSTCVLSCEVSSWSSLSLYKATAAVLAVRGDKEVRTMEGRRRQAVMEQAEDWTAWLYGIFELSQREVSWLNLLHNLPLFTNISKYYITVTRFYVDRESQNFWLQHSIMASSRAPYVTRRAASRPHLGRISGWRVRTGRLFWSFQNTSFASPPLYTGLP